MRSNASSSMSDLSRLSELIDSIYQAATEPYHWDVVLPSIAEWIDAPKGLLFTPLHSPQQGGYAFKHGLPDHMLQLWATKYHEKDIWALRGVERNLAYEGNVILGDADLIPLEELKQTDFYQELLSKFDVAHLLSSVVYGAGSPKDIPWAVCAWYRSEATHRFTEFERERLRILVPHISRSLGVMVRLRNMELRVSSSLTALDNLAMGVLLFNAQGMVFFANRAARRIFEDEDGLKLRHRSNDSSLGEIVAENGKANATLSAAIRAAITPDITETEHFSKAVVIPRPSGRQEYTLNFSSLAAQNEFGTGADVPRAIAFISDNAEPITLDAELLKKTYGLTPAEIRLAELMGESLTLDETANRLGVSRNTVKSQLQSIYGKTNTDNRAKLMRLIMSLSQIRS